VAPRLCRPLRGLKGRGRPVPGAYAPGYIRWPPPGANGIVRPGPGANGMMRPGPGANGMMRPGPEANGMGQPGPEANGMV